MQLEAILGNFRRVLLFVGYHCRCGHRSLQLGEIPRRQRSYN